jgi:hypothetical protein
MPTHVDAGGTCRCHFGTASSILNVTGIIPIATVRDFVPFLNVQPFGACICPGNPQVAAATAAAMGVLVPQPCVPAVDEPWTVPGAHLTVDGESGLCPDSTLRCRWGGVIHLVISRRP